MNINCYYCIRLWCNDTCENSECDTNACTVACCVLIFRVLCVTGSEMAVI